MSAASRPAALQEVVVDRDPPATSGRKEKRRLGLRSSWPLMGPTPRCTPSSWSGAATRLVALISVVALSVAAVVAGEVAEPAAARGTGRALQEKIALHNASALPKPIKPFTASGDNPFYGKIFYLQPTFAQSLELSIPSAGTQVKTTLEKMKQVPTAFWLSSKDRIRGSTTASMEGVLAHAASQRPVPLVTFVIYNVPNRDCAAVASNGEICCTYLPSKRCNYTAASPCAEGLADYKTQYIDPIADLLRQYDGKVPVVVVVEPDSLPNLSTNRANARCGNQATVAAYTKGIAYAVKAIATKAPNAGIYLDAGNGAWLGWAGNMQGYMDTVKELGVAPYLRGFATNVAGYQPLGRMCPSFDYCLQGTHAEDPCCFDPCNLNAAWNPSHNALNYALHLKEAMGREFPELQPRVIIDTSRNGAEDVHNHCATWCNVRGAGLGHVATTDTANPDFIDAYFWLKTPGESDGCSEILANGTICPRYDAACGSTDSIGSDNASEPRAPEAGSWFDFQIKQLAANAKMR